MDTLRDLQGKWDRASRWYDLAVVPLELLIFRRLRSRLLRSAAGRVLEVAAGTGVNLGHYPAGVDSVFVDLSPSMLERARSRGTLKVAVMDAGHSSIRTTEKHYAPFVLEFQHVIDAATAKLSLDDRAKFRTTLGKGRQELE